jgi:hypothetical protein
VTISIGEWIETPPTPERLREVDTDDLWDAMCLLRVQKTETVAFDRVRHEILRRARLGAAVEAMPKGTFLAHDDIDGTWGVTEFAWGSVPEEVNNGIATPLEALCIAKHNKEQKMLKNT